MEFYSATNKNEILSFTSKLMELDNIILSEVTRFRRPNMVCSPSYVDYRLKTNAVILLDMGYTLRGEWYRRNTERNGNLKLGSV
jgi:hypothetical protein